MEHPQGIDSQYKRHEEQRTKSDEHREEVIVILFESIESSQACSDHKDHGAQHIQYPCDYDELGDVVLVLGHQAPFDLEPGRQRSLPLEEPLEFVRNKQDEYEIEGQ